MQSERVAVAANDMTRGVIHNGEKGSHELIVRVVYFLST